MLKELSIINKYNISEWLAVLILGTSTLLVCGLLHLLLFKILKFANRKNEFLSNQIQERFKSASLLLLFAITLNIIMHSLFTENSFVLGIEHFLKILIILGCAWISIGFIKLGKELVLSRYDITEKDNLKARRVYTQFKIIEKILSGTIILVAFSLILMTFESIRRIGVSIFASAGVAGIILGLAAQKIIGTVLAGFQIAITQPIRLEDVVIVEGEWGWIEEITLTYVVIRIWDKRRLIVPTTYFIEKPFQNWTRVSADILGTVFIYTDYTIPFEELRNELTRILKADKNWDGKVNNMQVTNTTDKTIEIRALISAVDSPTAWDLRVNVREKLIEFLQKNHPECLPKTRVTMDSKP